MSWCPEPVARSARPLALAAGLLACTWPAAARAGGDHDACSGFINALPAVIASEGTWCLDHDLATAISTGRAIEITAHDVVIDCNGFKLGGLAAGAGTEVSGIYGSHRQRVTVRNCNIRGFALGIELTGAGGAKLLVEDNRFDGNTRRAMYLNGETLTVRRNQVFDTGGSTGGGNVAAYAISVSGSSDVLDNTVDGVAPLAGSGGAAYGIITSGNAGGVIAGNRVRNLVPDGSQSTAISNGVSGRVIVRDNDLVGDGGANSIGISCTDALGQARGNVVSNFAFDLLNCSDAGGNITP